MNQLLIDSYFLFQAIIIITWSIMRWTKVYGHKSSISAYAGPLTKDGKEIQFFIFIWFGIVGPLSFVADSMITTFAGMLLLGIGILTGFNPEMKNKGLQDILHVLFTNSAIILFAIGIIVINFWYSIIVGMVLIISIIMLIKKIPNHTKKIEIVVIIGTILCLIIQFVLIPIIIRN